MKRLLALSFLVFLSACTTETVILPLPAGAGQTFSVPGTCPAGYVVQNTTSSGVECIADVFGNGTSTTSSGGNMTMWRLQADSGSTTNVTNFSLVRVLSSTGISTTLTGLDLFIENTGVLSVTGGDGIDSTGGDTPDLSLDSTVCRSDGTNCLSSGTVGGISTTLYDAPQCTTNCDVFYDVMTT